MGVGDIALVCGLSVKAVHHPRIGVGSYVRLHAEEPLVALLRSVHFGVALMLLVLGRGRRGNDGGPP